MSHSKIARANYNCGALSHTCKRRAIAGQECAWVQLSLRKSVLPSNRRHFDCLQLLRSTQSTWLPNQYELRPARSCYDPDTEGS